ncbi:hypothetical protein [Paracoccus salsus]|uniref:hypothetical protein n=1 Tax=Paracoccus salsus TaxID=2911061 RepID=UPI001F208F5D|nr:hypothetical protein [Paracoccus salsus]MCF3975115.1 hypothetical protein [Paracoccus salsus]
MKSPAPVRRRNAGPPLAIICLIALLALLLQLTVADDIAEIFDESGPIERLSAIFLLAAGIWVGWRMIRRGDASHWHFAVLLLAAGLRELDWDKAFTQSGVLSLRLYSGDAPMVQKIAGAVILLALIAAGLRLLRRDLRVRLRLTAWQGRDLPVAGAICLFVVAKTLDGLARKLAPWGIEVSQQVSTISGRAEEAIELLAAILILQAVAVASPDRRPWSRKPRC